MSSAMSTTALRNRHSIDIGANRYDEMLLARSRTTIISRTSPPANLHHHNTIGIDSRTSHAFHFLKIVDHIISYKHEHVLSTDSLLLPIQNARLLQSSSLSDHDYKKTTATSPTAHTKICTNKRQVIYSPQGCIERRVQAHTHVP